MSSSTIFKTSLLVTALCAATNAYSDSVFSVKLISGPNSATFGFDDAEESFDSFDDDVLEALFPGFNKDTDEATAEIDYRGLPLSIAYTQDSQEVTLSIPSLGITNQSFNEAGGTRDSNLDDLKDFLSKDGGNVLNDINKTLAAVSSTDPVAGNPNSLMSQMIDEGFTSGFTDNTSTSSASNMKEEGAMDNQVALNLRFGKYTVDGKEVQSLALPIGYTVRLDSRPKHQIHFSLPIHYSSTEDADSYRIGLGVGYSYPVLDNWSITPAVSYGVMGSANLGSVGAIIGYSITSRYTWTAWGAEMALGNMVGSYTTQEIEYDDYEIDSELSNSVFKNGISYSRKISSRVAMDVVFSNTIFNGDDLYVEKTNEIGVSFGPTDSGNKLLDSHAKLGLSYLKTDQSDLDGFRLNLGVSF